MPHFDRFDICHAYYALCVEWGGGNAGRIPGTNYSVSRLTQVLGFKPGILFSGYDSLNDNAMAIYVAAVARLELCDCGQCLPCRHYLETLVGGS